MTHRSSWLKLFRRLCILAVLCASVGYLAIDPKVIADSSTTCIQCDSNKATGLANSFSQRDSCYQNCDALFPPGTPAWGACYAECDREYNISYNNTVNTYDNCLYGFTNSSGLCSIVAMPGHPPPSGRRRTQCDFDCRDNLLECGANGGTTCGEDYNICVLSCA